MTYNFNKKYLPIFNHEVRKKIRYIPIIGGRGSGKSTVMAHFLHDFSFSANEVILLSRYTMTSAKNSIIAEMEKTINSRKSNEFFKQSDNTLYNLYSNSKIIFKGLQAGSLTQTAQLKSITDLNVWVLDEAEEITDENMFDDVDETIRRQEHENIIILVLNSYRLTKEHFIYKRFFEDRGVNWGFNGIKDDVMYIHTTYLDNYENLSDSAKQKIKFTKDNYPERYDFRYLGRLREKAEGVIFTNWSIGEFDNSLPFGYGLDFGVEDPDSLVKVAVNDKKKIIFIHEVLYQNGLSTDKLFEKVRNLTEKNKLIVADSSAKRTILDMYIKGLNIIKCSKAPGSVLERIKKMLNYQIIITPTSINVIREFNNYSWADKRSETPIDANNHSIDAIAYIFEKLIKKSIISSW